MEDDPLRDLGLGLSVERFNRRDESMAKTFGHENTARGRAPPVSLDFGRTDKLA
jgi:hypothetical protein